MKTPFIISRLSLIFVFLLSVCQVAAQTCVPPPSGLIAWWSGDGNAFDNGGTHHGTLVGNTAYAVGKKGQAFRFDGSGDAVVITNRAEFQLQNLTIEAWVKRDSLAQVSANSDGAIIFGYGDHGYVLALTANGQVLLSKVGIGGVFSTYHITDLNFHHLAVTKSGQTVVFYLDGQPSAPQSYGDVFEFTTSLAIGNRGDLNQGGLLGVIDEIAIYNRGLAASEIQSIYNAGHAGKCILPPVISTQPQDQVVGIGTIASFNVAVESLKPVAYQWRFEGNEIAGATLTLTNVQTSNAGAYSVLVTNSIGSILSSNAQLTVITIFPPAITTQPQSQTVIIGADVAFNVEINSSLPATYQWRFNDVDIGGATASALALNNVPFSAAGDYRVVISNAVGSVTSAVATLTIVVPPSIVSQPSSQFVLAHADAEFQILASGTAPLTYQWFFHDSAIPNSTNHSLSLFHVGIEDSGGYHVVVSNAGGSATSLVATLTVNIIPSDFNNDAFSDLVWQNTDGRVAIWLMEGTNFLQSVLLRGGQSVASGWRISGQADLDRNGQSDLLWQHTDNRIAVWLMNGTNVSALFLRNGQRVTPGWKLAGAADFNQDSHADLLWQNVNGRVAVWLMDGTNFLNSSFVQHGQSVAPGWGWLI